MSTEEPKQLPLHERHVANHGNMVPFAGFWMPMQYTSIKEEHVAVREGVGLFDVSHMGEIEVKGPDAIDVVDRIVTNDVHRLQDGQALYTVMCNPDGGIVDDLLVYRFSQEHVFLCVNASTRDKDFAHIVEHAQGDAEITHRSDEFVQLALQGPLAEQVLQPLCEANLSELKYFWSTHTQVAGVDALVSRTGYTGEDGFEIYYATQDATRIFDAIVEAGAEHDMAFCGLGCRDTLRLEAKLHLYGQDMSEEIHPYEAGLSWVVKLGKSNDFVGKSALEAIKAEGVTRRLRGLIVEDRGVIRSGCEIYLGEEKVGYVTSGSFSITLEKSIGLGYIDVEHANVEAVEVAVRKRRLRSSVTKKPFYQRATD